MEVERTATDDERFAWGFFGYEFPEFNETARTIRAPHAGWLREIVANPFQPFPEIQHTCITSSVTSIAERADQDEEFSMLPILADALEENGCIDPVLLEHLRRAGPHCRGCWALDAVLGRE